MFIIGMFVILYNLYKFIFVLSIIVTYGPNYQVGLEQVWLNNCENSSTQIVFVLLKHVLLFGIGTLMCALAIIEPIAMFRCLIIVLDKCSACLQIIFVYIDKLRSHLQRQFGYARLHYIPNTFKSSGQLQNTNICVDDETKNSCTPDDTPLAVHVNIGASQATKALTLMRSVTQPIVSDH